MDAQLTHLSAARRALLRATTVQEVKRIHDVAEAAELYAKRQRLSDEAIGYAHSIRIEALSRLGGMLRRLTKHRGGRPAKTRSGRELVSTLAALGISRRVAMVAQQVAELSAALHRRVAAREVSLTWALAEHRRAQPRPPLPRGQFRVIYADPPWPGQLATSAAVKAHYPTMAVEEIAALNVRSLAATDAVLFLWVTTTMLFESRSVIEAWGFEYKTSIVWDKIGPPGMGHYVPINHELLLICTRGSCIPDRRGSLIDSVQSIPKSKEHSRKPDVFYDIIEHLYDGPRVELFARRTRPGWSAWGNELHAVA